MNVELGNIKTAFKPDSKYMSDLAMRIQRKTGIEAQELFQEAELNEPVLPRHPVQLSVEFGNSYVAESPADTFIEAPDDIMENVSDNILTDTSEDITVVTPEVSEPAAEKGLNEEKPIENTSEDYGTETAINKTQEPSEISDEIICEKTPSDIVDSNFAETVVQDTTSENGSTEVVESAQTEVLAVNSTFEVITEPTEEEKQRAAEIERKRAEAAARYAALLDESRADYVPIAKPAESDRKRLPWASILGIVASMAAIASAWWVWTLIQTPVSIEQVVENTRVTAPAAPVAVVTPKANTDIEITELSELQQLVLDELWSTAETESVSSLPHFTQMNERSKLSMVVLENNGLLVMEMEDEVFE